MSVSLLLKYFKTLEKIFYKLNKYFSGSWRLAVLDMNKGRWLVKSNLLNIPYLKAKNANGKHILMQPAPEAEPYYIIADDLTRDILHKHHMWPDNKLKPGRMIVETSPGNYQVWIHSNRKLSISEKKYWLKRLKSDPSASPKNRWGRCPGFRNRKEKYATTKGNYPLAKLVWVDWAAKADIPVPKVDFKKNRFRKIYHSIDKGNFLNSICRSDYERGNESITDFSYALGLARRGANHEYIKRRIYQERDNWDNHLGENRLNDYLSRTVYKAIKIVNST